MVKTIRTWRWIVGTIQAIVMLGLPFVRINGESALRFDIPALRLHVFGHSIWMQEFFIVLVATIFLALLVIFTTLVFGRVWCGWLCPQTVLIDFTPFIDRASKKGFPYKSAAYSSAFLISIAVAASLIWYFVSPYEFIAELMGGNLGSTTWGFWITLTVILFLNYAFLRHKWCKTVCPYAMLQSVMFDKSTLIIELDPARSAECINCSACVKACPTEMDIRNGFDAACINCAECIDACDRTMTRFQKKGLVRYAFGAAGEGKILRSSFFITGAFVILFLAALVYLAVVRTGVEVNVLPHQMEARISRDEYVINAYVLSVKNMRDKPMDLDVKVESPDSRLVQSLTEPVHINPGGMDKLPLFVKIKRSPGMKTKRLSLTLSDSSKKIRIVKEANFVIPDEL